MRPPRLRAASLAALDQFAQEVLGCPVYRARAGGVHVEAVRERALPAWHGYIMPLAALAFPEGAAIAVRPETGEALRAAMGSDTTRAVLDGAAMRRLWRATERLIPHAFVLFGDFRAVDADTFRPHPPDPRVEHLALDDPAALDLRRRFDGPVFGIRGTRGRLISWAALKLKSHTAWEVAVATDADYRGRGFARSVVSAATAHCLEQGRLCLYLHDHDNRSSGFVARSLGYQRYAEVVLAEF
jgi:GNAT superfamily N-acetyltransferase